jgi:hypothetical protein
MTNFRLTFAKIPISLALGYNGHMRRKSAIDRAKQHERIERSRRMKPEDRLLACVNLCSVGVEIQLAGKRYRETTPPRPRS